MAGDGFMTTGWFKKYYFEKGNKMTDREKELERRLAKCQRLWMASENRNIETTALLMLAQYEVLKLEFGEDLEKDQPELYESLMKLSKGV